MFKRLGLYSLFLSLFCLPYFTALYAATAQYVTLTATIAATDPVNDVSLVSDSVVNIGTVVPNYTWIDTPNVAAANQDPWLIAAPIKITLNIKNNNPAYNLYVYTDHQSQSDYWSSAINDKISAATNINGLVNTAVVSSSNFYQATAALRAWADYSAQGSIATDPNANWVWVNNKNSAAPFASQTSPLPLLQNWQTILNSTNFDIYIRSCWNSLKIAGQYKGRIFLQLDIQ
jgi:hypothetical protein